MKFEKYHLNYFFTLLIFLALSISASSKQKTKTKINLPENQKIISISPNGKFILAYKWKTPIDIYLYKTNSSDEPENIFFEGQSIDGKHVSWSPNSRYFAFTENAYQLYKDSDLYICDTESFEITNLTEDNYFGDIALKIPSNVFVDTMPVWKNNDEIYFLSSSYKNNKPCQELKLINIKNPKAIVKGTLSKKFFFSVVSSYYTHSNNIYFSSFHEKSTSRFTLSKLSLKNNKNHSIEIPHNEEKMIVWGINQTGDQIILYNIGSSYQENSDTKKNMFFLMNPLHSSNLKNISSLIGNNYSVRDTSFLKDHLCVIAYNHVKKEVEVLLLDNKFNIKKRIKLNRKTAFFPSESIRIQTTDNGEIMIIDSFNRATIYKIL